MKLIVVHSRSISLAPEIIESSYGEFWELMVLYMSFFVLQMSPEGIVYVVHVYLDDFI